MVIEWLHQYKCQIYIFNFGQTIKTDTEHSDITAYIPQANTYSILCQSCLRRTEKRKKNRNRQIQEEARREEKGRKQKTIMHVRFGSTHRNESNGQHVEIEHYIFVEN